MNRNISILILYLIIIIVEFLTFSKYAIVIGPLILFSYIIYVYHNDIKQTDFNQLLKEKSTWLWAWYITIIAIPMQWIANEVVQLGFNIDQPNINFAYAMVAAPIISVLFSSLIEEVIFRKIIFEWLDSRFNFYVALIISSALFALGHYNYAGWLGYFVLGLFWSWSYKKTGNIAIPILSHMSLNLITFIMITLR